MRKIVRYVFLSFSLFLIFFMCGCGLETVYVIEPPRIGTNEPNYQTSGYERKYFSFHTNEDATSTAGFVFQGTGVYYKIYTNSSTMLSVNASIHSLNTSNSYSSAAQSMFSRGYQPLGMEGGSNDPLVSYTGSDRPIEIRVSNYQENNNNGLYAARIVIDGSNAGVPRRNGNTTSFDFGRGQNNISPDLNKRPMSSDRDTDSSLSGTTYYVDMYAVNIGYDINFSRQYSRVLHLGAVAIDETQNDN